MIEKAGNITLACCVNVQAQAGCAGGKQLSHNLQVQKTAVNISGM